MYIQGKEENKLTCLRSRFRVELRLRAVQEVWYGSDVASGIFILRSRWLHEAAS